MGERRPYLLSCDLVKMLFYTQRRRTVCCALVRPRLARRIDLVNAPASSSTT